jgi:preprotein translocase subunit SecF
VVVAEGEDGAEHYQIRSDALDQNQKVAVSGELEERFGPFVELRFETVGPTVGALVTRNATIAVIMASVGILLYLTIAFHAVPNPIRYGTCAIIAMLHDVFIVVGLASIMGVAFGWEVDALFLTALLTIIGFSVHDSIVVFDRIRENVGRMRGTAYERIVNHSIIQTLDRSINTQLTALFTLVAVYVYSQGQLERFVFWLIVGIISGTYSSIFNAAPLLVVWENREWRNWFGRGRGEASPA